MTGRVRLGFVKHCYGYDDSEPNRFWWENELIDSPMWRQIEQTQTLGTLEEAKAACEQSVKESLGIEQ